MPLSLITSPENPLIKSIVRLHSSKERRKTQRCIIEGVRAIQTALSKLTLDKLVCTDDQLEYAYSCVQEDRIVLVSESLMKKISVSTTPCGLLGIFAIPETPTQHLTPGLVLAQVQDPGNMGTLIRTAVACNLSTVVIIEGCDPWSSKVIQSSAGTIALTNIFEMSFEELATQKQNLSLYALVVEAGEAPSSIKPQQALLMIGNEARGIPEVWLTRCDKKITIPMPGNTESLNAAVAGSLATYLTFVSPTSL